MNEQEALKLCDELWDLAQSGPGENPSALSRAREILRQIEHAHRMEGYLLEKTGDALEYLEIWFSPRRWQKWRYEQIRSIVNNDVYKVRSAVQSVYTNQQSEPSSK